MRRNTITLGAALVLTIGAAGLAGAQSAPPGHFPRRDAADTAGGPRGRRGPGGGPERLLLRGITLTDAQKAQLKELRQQEMTKRQGEREQMQATFEQARAARERGDTATLHALRAQGRARMEQERTQREAALRAVLTPDQQKQFDANLAELKAHAPQDGPGFGGRGRHAPPDNG